MSRTKYKILCLFFKVLTTFSRLKCPENRIFTRFFRVLSLFSDKKITRKNFSGDTLYIVF